MISERVAFDYDADGRLVGIDVDNASTKVGLDELVLLCLFTLLLLATLS